MPSLVTRVSASSGSHRAPSRSIHCLVRLARTSTASRLIAASTSPGLALRGCVASSITSVHGLPSTTSTRRMTGRTSSTTSRPLRRRFVSSDGDASAASRSRRNAAAPATSTSTRHSTAVTASCRAGARSTSGAAPVTARPSGNASVSTLGSAARSTGWANTTSRYSASLSWPVDSASPKLTRGRGLKPSVNASGSAEMRNARSSARATSRCEIHRIFPSLQYRSRTGNGAPPLMRAPRFAAPP